MRRDIEYFEKKLIVLQSTYPLPEPFEYQISSYRPGRIRRYQIVIVDTETNQEHYSFPGSHLSANDMDYFLTGIIDATHLKEDVIDRRLKGK